MLLKSQIPIRTFSEWDENKPGFIEVDLVGHDGGHIDGFYIQTLTATDIFTGWTETEAVKNKARVWVFEGLKNNRSRFPFPILGIDSDNGGEFINHPLYEYCLAEKISFTRSPPTARTITATWSRKTFPWSAKWLATAGMIPKKNRKYSTGSTGFFPSTPTTFSH